MPRFPLARRLPLALAALIACSDPGPPTTALDESGPPGIELVSAAELADARYLGDLSDEDRAAVREALAAAREEIGSILARLRAGEIDRAEARVLVEQVHARLLETLSQLLTEEQIERLLSSRPGGPDLRLTEEQRLRIRALRAECREAVARVRGAVESGAISAEEGRRRVRATAYDCRRRFCDILEPDQQARAPICRRPGDAGPDG